jgi:hypothetical protein
MQSGEEKFNNSVRKPEAKRLLAELGVDGRMILNWALLLNQ